MKNCKVSVIIPVYNNTLLLRRIIEAFLLQKTDDFTFELIIIDDASHDNPARIVSDYSEEKIIFIRNQKNKGPAFCRNQGLNISSGEIIIFSDGDVVPAPNFIREHLKSHTLYSQKEIAVLGNVKYPLDVKVTPLMRLGNAVETWSILNSSVKGFYDWTYFRTGNISLKKAFIGDLRFDEQTFKGIGFEDTEMGWRLSQRGMKIVYNDKAVSYHYHFRTPEEYLQKVLSYGKALARWTMVMDKKKSMEINRRYNCLIKEYNIFNLQFVKETFRRIVINDITAKLIITAARFFETTNERFSYFLYNKLYKYLLLKGYKSELTQYIKERDNIEKNSDRNY
ncbi:MAG: hypothetical protein B6D56_01415 [Candidatus Omnitrophica bacterium 4484_70.1]|nr:MAG: hypothetical protein B6D56_01415 [Candidatus Omnitrophica bacterium 4484_70.1]